MIDIFHLESLMVLW